MGRAPCCDKANVKKGPWSPEEDAKLKSYIEQHGTGGNWIALPQKIGLKRCGKSCRLRWLNYLRPNLKHGEFSEEEDNIICNLYISIGSRWSIIAAQLPGRTDNDIKNYWNTKLKKKLFGKKCNGAGQRKIGRPRQVNSPAKVGNGDVPGVIIDQGVRRNDDCWPPIPQPAPVLCDPTGGGHGGLPVSSGASTKDAPSSSSSSSSLQDPNGAGLSTTELDELFRFNSVKLEELDCLMYGSGEGMVNWNEESNVVQVYNNGMQLQHYWASPFEFEEAAVQMAGMW
ncbi:hypothetical protein Cni_G24183 [Canna indica]|uniref:Uncharacterized protein n=1 Tax=Canna indica TaxID=4628 RepID=A0AAQ3KUI0_9LILI|nr:hypothetical protein Cni_G24183 [Canna indica]